MQGGSVFKPAGHKVAQTEVRDPKVQAALNERFGFGKPKTSPQP